MSEMEKREEMSGYDSMSTEELQEILRKHAHGELDTQPDTDELFEIMEVLSNRRQQNDPQAFRSDEEAYAEFREFYMPKEDEKKAKALPFPARFMRAAAAVLVFAVVAVAGVGVAAEANNINLWEKFACWTQDIFHFTDGTSATQGTTPVKENNLELKSLQDALDKHMITEKLVPTWLPEGYVEKDLRVAESPRVLSIYANYEKNDERLVIKIRQTIGVKAPQTEKNDDLLEVYVVDGVEYYIFSNTETMQAVWTVGEFECIIGGKITLEEMKAMIDSI